MSDPKHTPGPWTVCGPTHGGRQCGFVFGDGGEVYVTRCFGPEDIDDVDPVPALEQHVANAHLIRSAPAMYAALKECANALESELRGQYAIGGEIHPAMRDRFDRDMEPVREARKVLVKARGEDATDA